MEQVQGKKPFYGWVVCGVCTLLIFITMGTASNGLSVFMPFIKQEYGLTSAQLSSLVTLRCTFAFIAMLLVGKYYSFVSYRLGTGIAALCCCIAYWIYSISSGYLQFCIGASMAGISYGLGSMIPVAILMNRWFVRHRALTVGICSAGSSFAIIVLPPILTGIILRFSLHTAFLFTAAFSLISAFIIFLLVRDRPQDKGLTSLGQEEMLQAYREQSGDGTLSRTSSLSRKGWALMAIVCVSMGALSNPAFMHLTVLFTSEGFRPMTVALIISVCGIVMTAFKVLCGESADLLGGFRASALFCAICFAGTALCCLAFLGSVPLAMTAGILFGIGIPITTVGIPVWAGELDTQEHFADTVRRFQLIYAAGAMLFATVPGIIADAAGSYIPAYIVFSGLVAIGFFCLAGAYRTK